MLCNQTVKATRLATYQGPRSKGILGQKDALTATTHTRIKKGCDYHNHMQNHMKNPTGALHSIFICYFMYYFIPSQSPPLCQQRASEPQATPTPAILPGRVTATAQPNQQAVSHRWSRRDLLVSSAKLPAKPAGHRSSRDLPALVIAPGNCHGQSGRTDTV